MAQIPAKRTKTEEFNGEVTNLKDFDENQIRNIKVTVFYPIQRPKKLFSSIITDNSSMTRLIGLNEHNDVLKKYADHLQHGKTYVVTKVKAKLIEPPKYRAYGNMQYEFEIQPGAKFHVQGDQKPFSPPSNAYVQLDKLTQIKNDNNQYVNLLVVVKRKLEPKEITKKDDTKCLGLSLTVCDQSLKQTKLTIWEPQKHLPKFKDICEGSVLRLDFVKINTMQNRHQIVLWNTSKSGIQHVTRSDLRTWYREGGKNHKMPPMFEEHFDQVEEVGVDDLYNLEYDVVRRLKIYIPGMDLKYDEYSSCPYCDHEARENATGTYCTYKRCEAEQIETMSQGLIRFMIEDLKFCYFLNETDSKKKSDYANKDVELLVKKHIYEDEDEYKCVQLRICEINNETEADKENSYELEHMQTNCPVPPTSTSTLVTTSVLMSDCHKNQLRRATELVDTKMNPEPIIASLHSKKILTEEERQKLVYTMLTPIEKVRELMSILQRKPDTAFDALIKSLKERGQGPVAQIILQIDPDY